MSGGTKGRASAGRANAGVASYIFIQGPAIPASNVRLPECTWRIIVVDLSG